MPKTLGVENIFRRLIMNSKKTIKGFINPNLTVIIILTVFPLTTIIGLLALLFGTLPTMSRSKKCLEALESKGELDRAATELTSANAKRYVNGKLVLTDNYIFCKGTGIVLSYSDVLWTYKHRLTRSLLFIPIAVNDSIYLATKTMKPREVATMGKDKMDEIKNAIVEIYRHNNSCLIGYTNENVAKYKALKKQ